MIQKTILHIDMNSYFASVELQANPFLRGRPVAVCSYLSPGGCIIASSREAKAKSIKTGCRIKDALLLDPGVIFLENEPAKYRSTTESIFSIFKDYSDAVEPYSIDEAFLDLSGWAENWVQAAVTAEKIRARIKNEVGEWLECSIGISWTRFLAEFAGDIAPKKSTLLIDALPKLEEVLRGRPLTDAWGIGSQMERRLNALGIDNLFALKNFSQEKIFRALGRSGYYLWANVNGQEISQISVEPLAPKSIGHSYSLPKKTSDKKYLASILYKLCEKTGRRLRARKQEAEKISVFFSFVMGGGIAKSWKTKDRLFSTEEISREANGLLEKSRLDFSVRLIAVSVSQLSPISNQLSLFAGNQSKKALVQAMDKLNDKYGEYTLVNAVCSASKTRRLTGLGFGKLGDQDKYSLIVR